MAKKKQFCIGVYRNPHKKNYVAAFFMLEGDVWSKGRELKREFYSREFAEKYAIREADKDNLPYYDFMYDGMPLSEFEKKIRE